MVQALRVLLPPGGEESQHWDNKHRRPYCHLQRDYFSGTKGEVMLVYLSVCVFDCWCIFLSVCLIVCLFACVSDILYACVSLSFLQLSREITTLFLRGR